MAATRVVDTVKESLPVTPQPALKSTFASAVAGSLGAGLAEGGWRERALSAVGAIGVAMVAHEVTALLSVLADRQKVIVMRAAGQR
jgi:hypothetical protein